MDEHYQAHYQQQYAPPHYQEQHYYQSEPTVETVDQFNEHGQKIGTSTSYMTSSSYSYSTRSDDDSREAAPVFEHVSPKVQSQPTPSYELSNCQGRKRALLIGINYIGSSNQLNGCINDVANIKSFLIQRFGFKEADMVILTDDQEEARFRPTKANIYSAMQWLVHDAQAHDSFFFHFSGHGGSVVDVSGDEDDGFDETIYPVDFEDYEGETGQIIDDELHDYLVKPLPEGCRLTAIFDSCHSGTVLDLPYIYSTKGTIKQHIFKDAGMGLLSAGIAYASGDKSRAMSSIMSMGKQIYRAKVTNDENRERNGSVADVVMFSGCKDDQTSADAQEAGKSTGAMSFAFISALRQNPNQSYQELLNSVRDILRDNHDGYVIQPTPTGPTPSMSLVPTPPPHAPLARRGLQQTLSLYQDWYDICNDQDDDDKAKVKVVDPSVRQLWQTVTTTVNCGNGYTKTKTKTITATATATVVPGQEPAFKCTDKCWSDYLWYTYGSSISVAQGFTGIVLMIIGLYLAVFGYRFFRPTMGLIGFVFFASMTWIGLVNNEPASGYPHTEIVYICVSIGLGLVGAVIFMFVFNIALYFVGATAGIFLAVFIMSWKESLVIQIQVARICFIVGLGVVLAFAVYLLEVYILIFCTSFLGAYLFIMGLDFFAHTGFVNAWRLIFDGNPTHYNAYIIWIPTYVMLAFVMVLCLASMGWQYYWNVMKLKRRFGVHVAEEKHGKE
ncbi:hypothetical protein [Absidia glauca]|uniref:Uncharacterized protein n=1 Tax=Absidia glauca TaxID=4829 RepID=A0A163K009_ABSGL|nr:hypothetical protein [Absidia glauca]